MWTIKIYIESVLCLFGFGKRSLLIFSSTCEFDLLDRLDLEIGNGGVLLAVELLDTFIVCFSCVDKGVFRFDDFNWIEVLIFILLWFHIG